jgi:hypothetical protein
MEDIHRFPQNTDSFRSEAYSSPRDRSNIRKDTGRYWMDLPTTKETFEHESKKQKGFRWFVAMSVLGTDNLKATWAGKERGRCIDHGIAGGWEALLAFSGR